VCYLLYTRQKETQRQYRNIRYQLKHTYQSICPTYDPTRRSK